MAVPLTFNAALNWTDATDPNNLPVGIRILTASDLMRYENFGLQAVGRINSTEATVESHTTDLTDLKKKLQPVATKTAGYTLTGTDSIVIGNAASLTLTLPSAVAQGTGKVFRIKNRHSSALTVAVVASGGTIDGAATKSLAQWAFLTVVSDGANWYIV